MDRSEIAHLVQMAARLDAAGRYAEADRLDQRMRARLAANPITDLRDAVGNGANAVRNWWDAGGGLGHGWFQGNADSQALLATIKRKVAEIKQRVPQSRLTIWQAAHLQNKLSEIGYVLDAFDPRAAARLQHQQAQQALSRGAGAVGRMRRFADDEARLEGDLNDLVGVMAYLRDERIFPGGAAVYARVNGIAQQMIAVLRGRGIFAGDERPPAAWPSTPTAGQGHAAVPLPSPWYAQNGTTPASFGARVREWARANPGQDAARHLRANGIPEDVIRNALS